MEDYSFLETLTPLRLQWIEKCLKDFFDMQSSQGINQGIKFCDLKILDLGCGPGFISLPLWLRGASLTAVDNHGDALMALKQKAQHYGHSMDSFIEKTNPHSLRCIQGDINTITFPHNAFHVVMVMDILEHLGHENVKNLLKSAFFWLKPGGLLLGSTVNRTPASALGALVFAEHIAHWIPKGTHRHEDFITPQELNHLFISTGFSHGDYQGFSLKGMASFFKALPRAHQWIFTPHRRINYFFKSLKSNINY